MLSCVEGGINTDPYNDLVHKKGSLVVSVPACRLSGPSSILTGSIIFISSIKYLEIYVLCCVEVGGLSISR